METSSSGIIKESKNKSCQLTKKSVTATTTFDNNSVGNNFISCHLRHRCSSSSGGKVVVAKFKGGKLATMANKSGSLRGGRHLVKIMAVATLMAFAFKTGLRSSEWNTRKSLFSSGLRTNPWNAKVQYNYANVMRQEGKTSDAIWHYKEALRLWPNYTMAHNNLATLIEDPTEAERHLKMALAIDPWHPNSLYNLAVMQSQRDNCADAVPLLRKCLSEDEGHSRASALLANCLDRLEPPAEGKPVNKSHHITITVERKKQPELKKAGTAEFITAKNERLQSGNQSSKRVMTSSASAVKQSRQETVPGDLLMDGSLTSGHFRLVST